MAETSTDDLKAGLAQLIERPPKGWGDFGLEKSRKFKDTCVKAQRALVQAKPAPATLRALTAELRSFYD